MTFLYLRHFRQPVSSFAICDMLDIFDIVVNLSTWSSIVNPVVNLGVNPACQPARQPGLLTWLRRGDVSLRGSCASRSAPMHFLVTAKLTHRVDNRVDNWVDKFTTISTKMTNLMLINIKKPTMAKGIKSKYQKSKGQTVKRSISKRLK